MAAPWMYTLGRVGRNAVSFAKKPLGGGKVKAKTASSAGEDPTVKAELSPGELTTEAGLVGQQLLAGILYSEYLADLQTLSGRYVAYNKMRSLGTVSALMKMIKLPIVGAEWRITGTDTALCEEIQYNLMEAMTQPWSEFLNMAFWAEFSGLQAFEKVWYQSPQTGNLWIKKFALRPMSTITEWIFDENGGLGGIQQRGWRWPQGQKGAISGEYVTVEVPVEKLFVFTVDKEDESPEGRGIFRDAYQHYYYLNALRVFAGIRVERTACGVPYAILEEAAGDVQMNQVLAMLQRIRTAENSGAVFPYWVKELGNFELGDPGIPFLDLMMSEEQNILRCGLAHFIGMGQGENTGAYALSEDASSLFLSAENGLAKLFVDYFNRYVIKQWVVYNLGPQEEYPKLWVSPIEVSSRRALTSLLVDVHNSHILDRGDQLSERVAESFALDPKLLKVVQLAGDGGSSLPGDGGPSLPGGGGSEPTTPGPPSPAKSTPPTDGEKTPTGQYSVAGGRKA